MRCDHERLGGLAVKLPKVPQRTTPAFAFSIVKRALLDSIAVREFGKPEIEEVVAFFGEDPPTCVFCGDTPIRRWDHLTPVSKGGDTTLGNMVPACATCDDSKGSSRVDVWALGDAPNSPRTRGVRDIDRRLSKIREYVAKYSYTARPPEERLNSEELRQFEILHAELQKFRENFDAFNTLYHQRTGLQ